ncbi:MAG: diaminopimelate epimerase [Ignavibacteriales bacterium]|nr:diaminopimelate epimerase [Ignavibacteriales bacterium]
MDFAKMTGAGNDFVVIDNRSKRIKAGAKAAKVLCDRRWGIGADGVLLLEKSRRAGYKMMYYNADGSYGGMCGNGGRCIAWFAFRNKIAARQHEFEALDHVYGAKIGKNEVVLSMKDPRSIRIGDAILFGSGELKVNFVDTGSPHVVVPVESLPEKVQLGDVDVLGVGRKLRFDAHFSPTGTNVNFIERAGRNSIKIRTYERGVEDETLACGTGSIASAIVAARLWNIKSPIEVIPKSDMPLRIAFDDKAGLISQVRLAGPAAIVYTGTIDL